MSFITKNKELILKRLEKGEGVAIPTETVYGLAADYTNEKAINKIFQIKKRPVNHPLIMHILPDWDLTQWVDYIPEKAKELIDLYWPGPLTMVFRLKKNSVSSFITGGQNTVAIRAPNHSFMFELLRALGRPIVAPSANPFEKISPTTAMHVYQHFKHEDIAILDGGRCTVGLESTILDMADSIGHVLRPGQLIFNDTANNKTSIRVPGNQTQHYQPYKPCYYFDSIDELNFELTDCYILCFEEKVGIKIDYCFPTDFEKICYEFYYQLQKADASHYQIILIERPQNISLKTINDKISRAALPVNLYLC